MTDDFRCVDATTLGELLDDRLPPDRQAEVTAHLEECEACRGVFDELAAGSRWWGDLRRYVRPDPQTEEFSPEGETAADGPDHEERLEFLAPPTGPGHLGRFGPYEVLGLLGRGGMGVVLKAFDPALHRLVAVKVLAPQLASSATARERFAREARAVAAIAHDHIVAIHAVDSWNGLPYLVMQYVPGRSLQERIDATGPLGVKEVLRIGIQAASGLAAAHARGVIHRDIKPSNILLENGVERVKITDFGLARAADDASLTQSGLLAGTPQYMAPEQARGEPVDPRADLFSLGSVLYAACTGRPPFRAETTMGVLKRVCDDTPRPIREVNPDVPDWLAAVIDRLLAKDPADRFATAEEVAELLEPFLAHVQHPSRFPLPPFPHRAAAAPPRRHWAAAALAAALVLGGLGIAEATGVADVRALVATVLRIRTRDGTLVVEVEDPDVTVSVDDENGEVTITGAGSHEVRLRPGRHQLQATKDGRPVLDELITITRGGKQVVRVRREPPEPADAAVAAGPRSPASPVPPRARRRAGEGRGTAPHPRPGAGPDLEHRRLARRPPGRRGRVRRRPDLRPRLPPRGRPRRRPRDDRRLGGLLARRHADRLGRARQREELRGPAGRRDRQRPPRPPRARGGYELRGVLARRQDARLVELGPDHQALGRGHRRGEADAPRPRRSGDRRRLFARRQDARLQQPRRHGAALGRRDRRARCTLPGPREGDPEAGLLARREGPGHVGL